MKTVTFKIDEDIEKKIKDLVKHLQGYHVSKVTNSDVIRFAINELYMDLLTYPVDSPKRKVLSE